jgi:hypothetical protein
LRQGRDAGVAARLAATYAFLADPSLRDPTAPARPDLAAQVFTLGVELNRAAADLLQRRAARGVH